MTCGRGEVGRAGGSGGRLEGRRPGASRLKNSHWDWAEAESGMIAARRPLLTASCSRGSSVI